MLFGFAATLIFMIGTPSELGDVISCPKIFKICKSEPSPHNTTTKHHGKSTAAADCNMALLSGSNATSKQKIHNKTAWWYSFSLFRVICYGPV
jgi:hypothetical protein